MLTENYLLQSEKGMRHIRWEGKETIAKEFGSRQGYPLTEYLLAFDILSRNL